MERAGNLSQTLGADGSPVQIYNPSTNMPYAGNVVPGQPAGAGAARTNIRCLIFPELARITIRRRCSMSSRQNSLLSRFSKNKGRNQFFGNFGYQGASDKATDLFGFQDATSTSGIDGIANWSRSYRPGGTTYLVIHFQYEFSRFATNVTPYFANRANISGNAGIAGNDQEPVNWGPPNLTFSSGVAGFSEPEYARNANLTNSFAYDTLWYRGRHTVQFGAGMRQQDFNIFSQQDPRGAFAFTGAATQEMMGGNPVAGTGSDLADFLIGVPDTAQLSFGNPDKHLRGFAYDAFVNDDWRVNSGITLNIGIRWEFATPPYGRARPPSKSKSGAEFQLCRNRDSKRSRRCDNWSNLSDFSGAAGLSRH